MNLKSILSNTCPKCNEGKVFTHVIKMNEVCPKCGLSFYPEQGFYVGAMIVSYIITTLIGTPILWYFFKKTESLGATLLFAFIILSLLALPVFKYSRLIYLHLDYDIDRR